MEFNQLNRKLDNNYSKHKGKMNCLIKRISLIFIGNLLISFPLMAQNIKDVPRSRTLITSGWDYYTQVPAPENMNPYAGPTLHERNSLHYTVYENLFYSSMVGGTVEPWLAESYEYNSNFTQVTVKLRKDVVWSDGERFDASDVVFTANMLLANAPEMTYSSQFKGAVKGVEAKDAFTVVFSLIKPNSRWARDQLAYNLGQAARFVIVPEHIWKGQNAKEFNNFDLGKGWPVGTGPYKLVHAGSNQLIFDLRNSWWASSASKQRMPQVQRIVYKPSTAEAHSQLYINNQLDTGRAIQIGAFEAAKIRNPKLISWSKEGPAWGAPDGCVYRLTPNNQNAPFNDREIRRAINYSLDRKQIINLAYEGSTTVAMHPLSSYGGLEAYKKKLHHIVSKSQLDKQDHDKVFELMSKKGFSKNTNGFWADSSGKVLEMNIQSQTSNPAGPIIAQQLKNAGFDAKLEITQNATFVQNARTGNFDLHLWVHCGSAYDPYQTLEHYHSKYVAERGKKVSNLRSYTRYRNPEMDAVLDKLAVMVPSPDDPAYVELVGKALAIYDRDLPDITTGEERHVITFNSQYWTGWPSADNPYMDAYPPWEGWARIVHNLKPAQ